MINNYLMVRIIRLCHVADLTSQQEPCQVGIDGSIIEIKEDRNMLMQT